MGVITSHGACARMEGGNVTNNLNYLFRRIKGGRKINCEAPPGHFSVTNGIKTEVCF